MFLKTVQQGGGGSENHMLAVRVSHSGTEGVTVNSELDGVSLASLNVRDASGTRTNGTISIVRNNSSVTVTVLLDGQWRCFKTLPTKIANEETVSVSGSTALIAFCTV